MNKIKSDYLDLAGLKEQMQANTTIYKKLIELFIISIEEYMNVMDKDLNTKNWLNLFNITHRIIPSVRIFGINELEPILLQLETNFKNQDDLKTFKNQLKYSLKIFNQVKSELQTEIKLLENASI